jgi:transposase-like protein
MGSPRRRYNREIKLEVISRVRESGLSQALVAKDLGINTNTLSRWM